MRMKSEDSAGAAGHDLHIYDDNGDGGNAAMLLLCRHCRCYHYLLVVRSEEVKAQNVVTLPPSPTAASQKRGFTLASWPGRSSISSCHILRIEGSFVQTNSTNTHQKMSAFATASRASNRIKHSETMASLTAFSCFMSVILFRLVTPPWQSL